MEITKSIEEELIDENLRLLNELQLEEQNLKKAICEIACEFVVDDYLNF